jgi:DNA-directed RNA polymerase specialized sigma subunit, sigma24 homolog
MVESERISPEYLSGPEEASQPIESAEAERIADIALELLSAGTRRLLELRATGLSLDEIAAVTGRPKGSIKSSISAARKELMKNLNQI